MRRKLRLPRPAMSSRSCRSSSRSRALDGAERRAAREAGAHGRQGEGRRRTLRGSRAGRRRQIAATPGPATDAATLNGQTAAQIAATPGPASSLIPASAITYRTQSFGVESEGATAQDSALCLPGEKAIGGGCEQASGSRTSSPTGRCSDGTGWRFAIFAESGNNLAGESARSMPSG